MATVDGILAIRRCHSMTMDVDTLHSEDLHQVLEYRPLVLSGEGVPIPR